MTRAASQLDIGSWQRLPGTRLEADAILSLVSATQSIHAYDFDANRVTALSGRLKEFQIIHFATHGLLNSASPALSGLILSLVDRRGEAQDGFLRLNDIFNLDLSAELVVLSACQTALGKAVKGEGIIGLTRGFIYAGAPRVLVSLWSVDDTATAELMSRFYRALLVDKRTAAASLRQAQLEMRTETQWQAAYFWAAFTLQGDWRHSRD